MTLRDLKRFGGYAVTPGHGWRHFHGGETPRCPYPDCGKAFMELSLDRIMSTRIPQPDDPEPSLLGSMICKGGCKRTFEIAVPLMGLPG